MATRQKYDVAGISKGIKLDYLNIHQGNLEAERTRFIQFTGGGGRSRGFVSTGAGSKTWSRQAGGEDHLQVSVLIYMY